MVSTILVVGATGNTGKSVMHILPKLLQSSEKLFDYRVLGLTRCLKNPAAQTLDSSPGIEMAEKDWTEIDATWLREHEVVRVYIAPHNQANHFDDESGFHVALLQAGVEYVVRVSSYAGHCQPTSSVYYGRSHWGVDNLLSQPGFEPLQWTSLQPNVFTTFLGSAASWITEYRKTGNQQVYRTTLAENAAVALIDPNDVGAVGAHLLALDDPAPHNKARYILNGPEDITGKQIVELIEKTTGVKVEKAEFKDVSWIDDLATLGAFPNKLLSSVKDSFVPVWEGKCSLSAGLPTSDEVLKLATPKRTPAAVLETMVGG